MTLISRLQPRDAELGARVMSTLALVAGGVTVAFAAVQPSAQGATVASVVLTAVSAGVVVVVALVLRRLRTSAPWVWATFPFGAVAMILALDLMTDDASVSAQIFFLFPALYAAFSLRRTGAVLVCTAAVAGDLVDVFALLPPRAALRSPAT